MSLSFTRRRALIAAMMLMTSTAAAPAQFRIPPAPVNPPTAQTQAVVRPVAVPQAVPVQVPVPVPGAYGAYPVQQTRANGYLTGVASLMDATGNYQIQQQ